MALEESAAITDKFLDAVVAVAAESGGVAGRVLTALRERKDPRLRGFRTRAADHLERFFVAEGYIDDKPVLDENQLLARALDPPAAGRLSPGVSADLLHQWWGLSQHALMD